MLTIASWAAACVFARRPKAVDGVRARESYGWRGTRISYNKIKKARYGGVPRIDDAHETTAADEIQAADAGVVPSAQQNEIEL